MGACSVPSQPFESWGELCEDLSLSEPEPVLPCQRNWPVGLGERVGYDISVIPRKHPKQ